MPCRVIPDLPFLVRATSNLCAASHGFVFIARPVFEEGRGIERPSHAHAQVAIAAQLQHGEETTESLGSPITNCVRAELTAQGKPRS